MPPYGPYHMLHAPFPIPHAIETKTVHGRKLELACQLSVICKYSRPRPRPRPRNRRSFPKRSHDFFPGQENRDTRYTLTHSLTHTHRGTHIETHMQRHTYTHTHTQGEKEKKETKKERKKDHAADNVTKQRIETPRTHCTSISFAHPASPKRACYFLFIKRQPPSPPDHNAPSRPPSQSV